MPISLAVAVADVDDLRWVERAVRSCPVAMAEFGGFYAEVSQRLPAMASYERELLVVRDGPERIGFLDTDADVAPDSYADPGDAGGDTLGLAWFVVPEARGQRVTATALGLLRRRRPGWRLLAAIDAENGPSLGAARRAGFVDVGANRWGERVHLLE